MTPAGYHRRFGGTACRIAAAWLLLCAPFGLAAQAADAPPVVAVDGGRLAGTIEAGDPSLYVFRGIPFAAAPVGTLRWRPPHPVVRWQGIRPASAFGARCMQQPLFSDMMFRSPGVSEDCLFLNVWTPARPGARAAARLPVLVYIHGGGFLAGDGSERRYDGAALARRGIVVVTLNYRLGAFGFLAHPALSAESPHHASGNFGMLDQVAALDWVKRNVAAFGGDPARITIGGESAGSMSVSVLMASPLSRAMIAGAIGESGAAMQKHEPQPLAVVEAKGAAFAAAIGVRDLAAMRALPADRLLAAQATASDLPARPVIDGYLLTEPPATTFAAGRAAHVPLLVGSNSQEAPAAAVLGEGAPTLAAYRAGLARRLGDRADAVFALYPARSDADVLAMATAVASDDFLALPTWKWFDLQRRSGAPTYLYNYERVRPRFLRDPGSHEAWGAVHSAEIEYALGNLDTNPIYAWTPADRQVSATMRAYWANFVKTGDPNGAGLPAWPKASRNDAGIRRQIIDVTTRSAAFPEQRRYTEAEPLLFLK